MSLQKSTRKYRKTKKGILTNIYNKQKERSLLKGYAQPDYTLEWLHNKFIDSKKMDRLHKEWIKSGFDKFKKPSIDRINCKKPYTKRNIHLISWGENRFKQTMERRCRKGAVLQLKNNKVIRIYKSQREAVKKNDFNQGNISSALNGIRKKAHGFSWKYAVGNIYEEGGNE